MNMMRKGQMRGVEQGGGTTLESLCAGLQRSDVQVTSFSPLSGDYSPPTDVESPGAICKPRPSATRAPRAGSTRYQ